MIAIIHCPPGKIRDLVLSIIASKENQDTGESSETYDQEMAFQNRKCPVCGKRWGDHSSEKLREHGQNY